MEKAMIIYQSINGTTKQLGHEIGDFFKRKGIQTHISSVDSYQETDLSAFNYVFLGCWTKGLMILAQHPDRTWQQFVKQLQPSSNQKIGLFTSYKIATGSMFSKMTSCLPENSRGNILRIKSRTSSLPADMMSKMEDFIASEKL